MVRVRARVRIWIRVRVKVRAMVEAMGRGRGRGRGRARVWVRAIQPLTLEWQLVGGRQPGNREALVVGPGLEAQPAEEARPVGDEGDLVGST